MLINVKMPTIVCILTFMSMINSILRVEHEKFFFYLSKKSYVAGVHYKHLIQTLLLDRASNGFI